MSLGEVYLVALGVISIHVGFNNLWMLHFSFGLVERTRRCAIYGKLLLVIQKEKNA